MSSKKSAKPDAKTSAKGRKLKVGKNLDLSTRAAERVKGGERLAASASLVKPHADLKASIMSKVD